MGGISELAGDNVLVTIGEVIETGVGANVMVLMLSMSGDIVVPGSDDESTAAMLLLRRPTSDDEEAELEAPRLEDMAAVLDSSGTEYEGGSIKLLTLLIMLTTLAVVEVLGTILTPTTFVPVKRPPPFEAPGLR